MNHVAPTPDVLRDARRKDYSTAANVEPRRPQGEQQQERKPVAATRFVWTDPSYLPRRQWLYPSLYVRKFLTATIAPGGTGKTGLGLVEALAMVTGKDLLGDGYSGDPLRVWLWNGEDPADEMQRQVHAAMIHYNLRASDIGDRFFLDSGRDLPIKVAFAERSGFKLDRKTLDQLTSTIRDNQIDVAIFDPFVSIHSVSENDNPAMDAVAKALAQIANDCDCAMGIAAHTRKQQAGSEGELSADDARGGKALVDAARVNRVLNRMTKQEAEKAGIVGSAHRRYFWIGNDKVNLTPPDAERKWRYLESVSLPNGEMINGQPPIYGDNMRVVTSWEWPDLFSDISAGHLTSFQAALAIEQVLNRQNVQSAEWAGHLLSKIFKIDTGPDLRGSSLSPAQKAARTKCKTVLETWQSSGALGVEVRRDEKRSRDYQVYVVADD